MLDTFTRHGGPTSMPIAADMCFSCGGLWLDGGEVAVAYPALAVLQERRADVVAVGRVGAGIAACLRCEMPAIEVPFFDVPLDTCTACFGVWIDGDEIEALSRCMDRGDGLPVPEAVVGGYRTAAAGVLTKHLATCALCQKEVPLRATQSTREGAVCEACAAEKAAAEEAADKEEYRLPTGSSVWGFFCDVAEAIGAAIASAPRCSTCGCRSTSHCGH